MLITSLDYSSYTGRIAIGRLHRGELKENQQVMLIKRDGKQVKSKIKELYTFEGLGRKRVPEVQKGNICAVVGLEGFEIGDTIADIETNRDIAIKVRIRRYGKGAVTVVNNGAIINADIYHA